MSEEQFVLVRLDMLPEAVQKTLEAKHLLETGKVITVQEAVDQVGLSRSSFYKYKDSVFPFNKMVNEKIVTLSMVLEHRAGVLSNVLSYLAQNEASVLTIHQTIPLNGQANVSMSVDTMHLNKDLNQVVQGLKGLKGVQRALVISSGKTP
jgi:chorismate mutase